MLRIPHHGRYPEGVLGWRPGDPPNELVIVDKQLNTRESFYNPNSSTWQYVAEQWDLDYDDLMTIITGMQSCSMVLIDVVPFRAAQQERLHNQRVKMKAIEALAPFYNGQNVLDLLDDHGLKVVENQ